MQHIDKTQKYWNGLNEIKQAVETNKKAKCNAIYAAGLLAQWDLWTNKLKRSEKRKYKLIAEIL